MRLLSYLSPGFPEELFEKLAAVIDAEVHFETEFSGPAPGHDPFKTSEVDLGWICATSFVDLTSREPEPSVQLVGVAWVPDDPDANGRPVYFGDLVGDPSSDITSLEGLAGARIGCNDRVSLSGYYALRHALAERGCDPDDFAELVFTGGHHRSLDLLLEGELDAAVIDSIVRTGRARLDPAVANLRIIDRLGPWPVQPLVARTSLTQSEVDQIRTLLLEASPRPDVQQQLHAACLTDLVEVGIDHYEPVRTIAYP